MYEENQILIFLNYFARVLVYNFEFILNYIGIKEEDKNKWIMFGDRIDTDIKFGKNSGIDTTFVLTGCHTVDDMNNPEINSSFEI